MEKNLDRVMDEIINKPNVSGCLFADQQGLCFGVKGRASTESAGVITAIADQASKLEPNNKKTPIICIESDSRNCIIQKLDRITGAIYLEK